MTKYIKTGTTEFEQFNETRDQCFKFGIIDKALLTSVESVAYGADRYTIPTLEGDMVIHPTDWIATGVNGEHLAVKDEIFNKTYKKLPVITAAVAYYIGWCKGQNVNLRDALYFPSDGFNYVEQDEDRIGNWASNHQDEFARAWLDGYEVEEEEK